MNEMHGEPVVCRGAGDRGARPLAAACALALVGVPAGICVLAAGFTWRGTLLVSLCMAILGPLAVRLMQTRRDVFEPLVAGNVALAVMFIARPVADLLSGNLYHLGYDIGGSFDRALGVALAGTAAFGCGYFCGAAGRVSRFLPKPALRLDYGKATTVGVIASAAGIALFAAFLLHAGGAKALHGLLAGRQGGDNALFLNSTAYLYFGLFALVPASVLFFAAARKRGSTRWGIAAALAAATVMAYEAARGDRSGILPLLALPIFWYLSRGRRPGPVLLSVVSAAALVASGVVRDARTVAARMEHPATLQASLANPYGEMKNLLRGADTEMFDALAAELLVVPGRLPFRPGGTVTDLGIRAVPRLLWRDKPLEVNDAVVQSLWPRHYQVSRAAPAFSVLGPFYADSGWLGVVAGMLLLGIGAATLHHWYRQHAASPGAQICYSLALPLIVLLMRGTIPDTLGHALFLVVPAMFAVFPGGRQPRFENAR